MLERNDAERLIKARDAAGLLASDLRALYNASNPLLSELAGDLHKAVVGIHIRLERIASLCGVGR